MVLSKNYPGYVDRGINGYDDLLMIIVYYYYI